MTLQKTQLSRLCHSSYILATEQKSENLTSILNSTNASELKQQLHVSTKHQRPSSYDEKKNIATEVRIIKPSEVRITK